MSTSLFTDLCSSFCTAADLEPPALHANEDGTMAFHATLDGHNATIMYSPLLSATDAFIVFEYGDGPAPDNIEGWKDLLRTNLIMLGKSSAVFGLSDIGKVTLQFALPLASATAADLHNRLRALTEIAGQWQATTDALVQNQPAGQAQLGMLA